MVCNHHGCYFNRFALEFISSTISLALQFTSIFWILQKIIDNKTGRNVLGTQNESTKNVSNEKNVVFMVFGMVYYSVLVLRVSVIVWCILSNTHTHLHLRTRRIFVDVSVCLLRESVCVYVCVRLNIGNFMAIQCMTLTDKHKRDSIDTYMNKNIILY